MDVDSGYVPVESSAPLRGLLATYPSTRITPEYSPLLLNVTVRDGVVRRRMGYLQIGERLDGTDVRGFIEFGPIGSAEKLVVFTETSQYYYDAANNEFIDISLEASDSSVITVVDVDNKKFTLTGGDGDLSDHFQVGTWFVVVGSTGNDGTYTVVGVTPGPPTVVEVSETIDSDTANGSVHYTLRFPITVADAVNDHFTVAGTSLGFSPGDTIFVEGSAGDVHDGTWVIDTGGVQEPGGGVTELYVTGDITSSSATGRITRKEDLTTTDTDQVSFVGATDTIRRRLLFTNGLDNPIQWSGNTTVPHHFIRWHPRFESFTTCGVFQVFKEHLFMGDIIASATEPQLIAWSNAGHFDNFVDGTAGVQLLYELVGGIVAMEPLGDRLAVFSPDAIATGVFIGLPAVFAFETIIPEGIRLASPKSIVSINVGLVYAAEENIYLFDGTRGLRILSDLIYTDYKTTIDHENLHRAAAINDYAKKTIYLSFPNTEESVTTYSMLYDAFDLSQRTWSKEIFTDHVRAYGFLTNSSTLTWVDTALETKLATDLGLPDGSDPPDGIPDMTWEYEKGIWGNEADQANFPIRVFGDVASGVYQLSESVVTDHDQTTNCYYDTIDFSVPQAFLSLNGRWGELEMEASGGEIRILTSVNKGGSYQLVDTYDFEGELQEVRFPIDLTSRTLRVRFEFSDNFLLRWVRAWVKPAAAR